MKHNKGITADASEMAALAVDGPQPVWMTLNEARERAFTGEIVFETDPEVLAYVDHGIVYYAERVTDASLGRRLLDAGVIDVEQLDRGTVRVGDIEHLGRLFDRDPSVDRDAVIVVAETATEELIADLANRAIATVRVTAYRHHPSGVHRWFVAPFDPAAPRRPVSAVAQLDSTVVDDLPGLPFADAEELIIEWDQLDDIDAIGADGFDGLLDDDLDDLANDVEILELSLDLAEFTDAEFTDADVADDVLTLDQLVDVETGDGPEDVVIAETTTDDFEFAVVWPDGSEELATEANVYVEQSATVAEDDVQLTDEPVVTETDDGTLEFTMPPLELSDDEELADAEVPDDVAEAVRRAIAAIESASAPSAAPVSGFGGFAPPTMAMSAEVLYGLTEDDTADAAAAPTLGESAATGGVASVVFVDDPAEEHSGGNERSSALRRLIGSLRRKDH